MKKPGTGPWARSFGLLQLKLLLNCHSPFFETLEKNTLGLQDFSVYSCLVELMGTSQTV